MLAPVHGVTLPTSAGGKYRQIMVDIDQTKLLAKGLTPLQVVNAVNTQNLTLPGGDAKIGKTDYTVRTNSMPLTIEALNAVLRLCPAISDARNHPQVCFALRAEWISPMFSTSSARRVSLSMPEVGQTFQHKTACEKRHQPYHPALITVTDPRQYSQRERVSNHQNNHENTAKARAR